MTGVLVLGSSGMLGSMLFEVLGSNPDLEVAGTAREPGDDRIRFDAEADSIEELLARGDWEWVINAIGVTKPHIDESDADSVSSANAVNAEFPHRLATAALPDRRVIAISTDGVFSGSAGPYDEAAAPNDPSVYGSSKASGELDEAGAVQLRCSIIGPEPRGGSSLLAWALSQPRGARIQGYENQLWNGITTWHFSKLCETIVLGRVEELPRPLHVVPADTVSKAELLRLLLAAYRRDDVTVEPAEAGDAADRRLATRHPEANARLWAAIGHDEPPAIAAMVEELAAAAPLSGEAGA